MDSDARKIATVGLGCWGVSFLGVLAFWAGVAYVVMHFVLKFW